MYYLGGYIIHKINTNYKVCDNCINATTGNTSSNEYSYATFTEIRCFKEKSLFFINEQTFDFILKLENIFRMYYDKVCLMPFDVKLFLIQKCDDVYCDTFVPFFKEKNYRTFC